MKALLLLATLLFPNLNEDHQPLDLTLPQIGANILAIPGSTWFICFNEEFGNLDPDFNDACALMEFSGPQNARLTFFAAVSPNRSVMRLAFHGGEPFIELHQSAHYRTVNNGHEVTIELLTSASNATFFSGPAILNPDSQKHAFVTRIK